jgi:hypothetical protein
MRRLGSVAAWVVLGALLAAGCQHTRDEVAPVPPASSPVEGGGLLKTGAIQLGPGVGKNNWRWQGDGQWGLR